MVDYPLKTIPQLTDASALSASDHVVLSQSGNTRKGLLSALATFVLGTAAAVKLATWNAATTAPSSPVKGTPWLDTSTTPLHNLKLYDGAAWISLGVLDITNDRFTPALKWMTAGTFRGRRPSAGDGLETDLTVAQMQADLGIAVQKVIATNVAQSTVSAVIPFDNTIPQNTEGVQILSASITPKSASSKLLVRVSAMLGVAGVVDSVLMTAFNGTGVNAVAATVSYMPVNGHGSVVLEFVLDAVNTAARTIAIRAGTSAANGLSINQQNASPRFGGVIQSTMVIEEYTP